MENTDDRRGYIKTVGALVAGLAVGGAAAWLAKPAERVEMPGVTETVTETAPGATVTAPGATVTTTVTAPATPTPTVPVWEEYLPRADRFLEDWVMKWAELPTGKYVVPYDPMRYVDWDAVKAEFKGLTIVEACEGVDISAPELFKPAFEALTGATVEIFGVPTEVYHEKLMAEFLAPVGRYDAVELFGSWGAAYEPYIIDMRPIAEKLGIDIESYHPAFRMQCVLDGKVLGFPMDADMHVLHYRTNLLEKYVGTDRPPQTYTQVLEYCEKLSEPGKAEGWYPWCVLCGKDFWAMWYWYQIFMMYGGELFKPGTWEPMVNSEEGVVALKIYKKLLDYSPPGALHFYYGDARESWLGGKHAMFHLWQCVGRQAYDPELSAISPLADPTNKLGHAPLPGGTHFNAGFLWTTTFMSVPKTSAVPELGALWASFLTSAEATFILAAAGTGVESGHTSVLQEPLAWRAHPPYRAEWLQLHYSKTEMNIPETYDIELAIGESIYPYLEGTAPDPKACLDTANERVRKILSDARYYEPGVPPPPPFDVKTWCERAGIELPYSGWEPPVLESLEETKRFLGP